MIKHLYLHIPTCKYICSYCDFCKKYINSFDLDSYLDYLDMELAMYNQHFQLDTLFIGGGTPSTLSIKQLEKLASILHKYISFNNNYEFSFEANPDDLDKAYCQALKNIGVNRISIGVQTINDEILKILGRKHTNQDVITAISNASLYFDNISIDLMFNLPNQSMQDIKDAINLIDQFPKITHLSFYDLILEPHTKLYNQNYHYLDEEQEAIIYGFIQKQLEKKQFIQYEISNFSKHDQFPSKHNLAYWQNKQYIGIGLGGSSYYQDYRYTNTYSITQYKNRLKNQQFPIKEYELVNNNDYLEYQIMLGLRTSIGIEKNLINLNLIDEKYYNIGKETITIKPEYYFISNELILQVLEARRDV